MVEMGYCIGKCRDAQRCFFVKDYFTCGHLCCYNIAIKFGCCIKCGNSTLRYYMTDNRDEVVMNHTILKTIYCYCIKC
jgi:hypothetical protein